MKLSAAIAFSIWLKLSCVHYSHGSTVNGVEFSFHLLWKTVSFSDISQSVMSFVLPVGATSFLEIVHFFLHCAMQKSYLRSNTPLLKWFFFLKSILIMNPLSPTGFKTKAWKHLCPESWGIPLPCFCCDSLNSKGSSVLVGWAFVLFGQVLSLNCEVTWVSCCIGKKCWQLQNLLPSFF